MNTEEAVSMVSKAINSIDHILYNDVKKAVSDDVLSYIKKDMQKVKEFISGNSSDNQEV